MEQKLNGIAKRGPSLLFCFAQHATALGIEYIMHVSRRYITHSEKDMSRTCFWTLSFVPTVSQTCMSDIIHARRLQDANAVICVVQVACALIDM